MNIRHSTNNDRTAICAVHMDAFGSEQGPEITQLVCDLFEDETANPMLSLVAEKNDSIIGHVLFTAVTLQFQKQVKEQTVFAQILAPLAVSTEYQRQGIGGALIKEGLNQLTTSGVGLVFVLGYPDYYKKFGFQPAGALGFAAPYPIAEVHQDAWMVQALQDGLIGHVQGEIQCAKVLDQPQHWQE